MDWVLYLTNLYFLSYQSVVREMNEFNPNANTPYIHHPLFYAQNVWIAIATRWQCASVLSSSWLSVHQTSTSVRLMSNMQWCITTGVYRDTNFPLVSYAVYLSPTWINSQQLCSVLCKINNCPTWHSGALWVCVGEWVFSRYSRFLLITYNISCPRQTKLKTNYKENQNNQNANFWISQCSSYSGRTLTLTKCRD